MGIKLILRKANLKTMISMDIKQQILHFYRVEGLSLREISRRAGVDRKTVMRLINDYEAAIKANPETGVDDFLASRPKYSKRAYAPKVVKDEIIKDIDKWLKENERRCNNGMRKQGSVISIVRGTKAEDVIEVLMKIPEEARLAVKEVTMDLSSSMRAIVSTVFPNATIVLDCFHVLKRCHDAIEEVRLHLKRDAQVELRRQEREHRQTQKRRAQSRRRYRKKHPRKPGAIMRGRPPKRKNERFKAPTYSNGDTKLELLTRTKRALTQSREKWSDKTAERMKILFQEEPKLKEAYDIVNGLRSIFRSKTLDKEAAKVKLHDWYETATRCSLREIKSARDAIKSREDEVLNYFINHSTNAGAESLNSKIKTFRSQLRGVSDYTFFMYRIYKIFG